MSHKKFGPDRFSRFDVFLGTNRQTNKQTDKPNLYIDGKETMDDSETFFRGFLSLIKISF